MAARGIVATPGEIAAAAKDAVASRDFVKRVTARAVRETSGAKFSDGGRSWSRKLWSNLEALASPHGALSAHLSREDAAAELLRAQLVRRLRRLDRLLRLLFSGRLKRLRDRRLDRRLLGCDEFLPYLRG